MKNTKTLTRVALLVAIELVMKMVGLGSVPVGPLYMSFLTLPIAVGAITMGPAFRPLKIRPQHRPISTRMPTHRIKVLTGLT